MAKSPPILRIIPFQSKFQQAVQQLVVNGLVEHWGFLDESLNADLRHIATSYAQGTFLVAWLDSGLVGTGAYLPRSPVVVEILRMSVAKEVRRQGIGSRILLELCRHAHHAGYQQAILETTRTWKQVIAFYQNFGFAFTHFQGEDAYFKLDLNTLV